MTPVDGCADPAALRSFAVNANAGTNISRKATTRASRSTPPPPERCPRAANGRRAGGHAARTVHTIIGGPRRIIAWCSRTIPPAVASRCRTNITGPGTSDAPAPVTGPVPWPGTAWPGTAWADTAAVSVAPAVTPWHCPRANTPYKTICPHSSHDRAFAGDEGVGGFTLPRVPRPPILMCGGRGPRIEGEAQQSVPDRLGTVGDLLAASLPFVLGPLAERGMRRLSGRGAQASCSVYDRRSWLRSG